MVSVHDGSPWRDTNGSYITIFARGMTISTEANPQLPAKVRPYWTECGKALQSFNTFCKNDPRIDTVLIPVYDGVTFIKWK